jgi:tRNA G18 (ribose-2'-O)-methylase SpoU
MARESSRTWPGCRPVRASRGGIFGLRLVRASHDEAAGWASCHGCRVVGMSPCGGASYPGIGLRSPLLVLFGEERRGLTERELALCTDLATIPVVGPADSLNLGVAAGIVLFDLLRRRSAAAGQAAAPVPGLAQPTCAETSISTRPAG